MKVTLSMLLMACILYVQTQDFALYSLSMKPANTLAVYSGDKTTGEVSYVSEVLTGGNGTGAGVQSQSILTIAGNYLFSVNPASNSISMFSINPTNPTIVNLIGTISSQGEYPNTITTDGQYSVCVANSGAVSTIACYSFNSQGLTLIPSTIRNLNLNLTTPPAFHTGPGQITFTPDNKGLIVVVKGRNPPFYLFTTSYTNNVLSLNSNPSVSANAGQANFDVAFDSDGSFVVVDTNPFGPNNSSSGAQLVNVNTSGSGSLTFAQAEYTQFPGVLGSCWISHSEQTGLFYASDTASGIITVIQRTGNSLSSIGELQITNQPGDSIVLTLAGVDYLFVTERTNNSVYVFKLSQEVSSTDTVQIAPLVNGLSGLAGYVVSPAATPTPTPTPTSTPTSTPTPVSCANSACSSASKRSRTTINFYFADILSL